MKIHYFSFTHPDPAKRAISKSRFPGLDGKHLFVFDLGIKKPEFSLNEVASNWYIYEVFRKRLLVAQKNKHIRFIVYEGTKNEVNELFNFARQQMDALPYFHKVDG